MFLIPDKFSFSSVARSRHIGLHIAVPQADTLRSVSPQIAGLIRLSHATMRSAPGRAHRHESIDRLDTPAHSLGWLRPEGGQSTAEECSIIAISACVGTRT